MYSDDPVGNKSDITQPGELATPDTLARNQNAVAQFEAFIKKHPFVTATILMVAVTTCGSVMIYRFVYDQFNDFTVNVSGDFERKLTGHGSGGNVYLQTDDQETVIINFPDDLPPERGTHELGPFPSDYQLEVTLIGKDGVESRFPADSVVSGHVTITNIPDDCYEEIRGKFEAVMREDIFEIEVKGSFDFDSYLYYEDNGDTVVCEDPLAW